MSHANILKTSKKPQIIVKQPTFRFDEETDTSRIFKSNLHPTLREQVSFKTEVSNDFMNKLNRPIPRNLTV